MLASADFLYSQKKDEVDHLQVVVRRKDATLQSLTMEIPFREEVARLMAAYGAPGKGAFAIGKIPVGDDVLVSMWTLPDRALLCAFNYGEDTETDVSIRLPLEDLDLMPKVREEYIRGYNFEDNKVPSRPSKNFNAWSGTFRTNIPHHDYQMLVVRKFQAGTP